MLPTTSTKEGIERSRDTTAPLKACRDAIQSLCSAPFSLTMMNSVIKNGSKLPKTTQAHLWRHLLSSRHSKMGYSTTFSRYPFPANSYVSRSTCEPRTRATSDIEGPTTLRSCPRTAASRLASPLYLHSTATHTLRNVSRSHVRTKIGVASDPSSNSTLNWPHDFTHFTTRDKIHGYIAFSKIDCKQDISNENVEQITNFREWIPNFLEPIRI